MRGVSLRTLAADTGVNIFLLRRHEAGVFMLRADTLVEIASYLRIRPGELLYRKRKDHVAAE